VFIVVMLPLDDRVMLKEPTPKLPSRLPLHVPKSAESTAPRGEGPAGTEVMGIGEGVGAVGVELVPFPPQAVKLSTSNAKHVNRLADFIRHPICPLVEVGAARNPFKLPAKNREIPVSRYVPSLHHPGQLTWQQLKPVR